MKIFNSTNIKMVVKQMCKKCLTMHIDNFDESTYLWLLEKMDVPYVPEEWKCFKR